MTQPCCQPSTVSGVSRLPPTVASQPRLKFSGIDSTLTDGWPGTVKRRSLARQDSIRTSFVPLDTGRAMSVRTIRVGVLTALAVVSSSWAPASSDRSPVCVPHSIAGTSRSCIRSRRVPCRAVRRSCEPTRMEGPLPQGRVSV
jgi:hypothetical protein